MLAAINSMGLFLCPARVEYNGRVIVVFVGVVLFIAACLPQNVRSADPIRNGIVGQLVHNDEKISGNSLELHDELCDKELSRVSPRDLYIDFTEEYRHELLDEMKKNEIECQKKRDHEADILEKLLLESTSSEASSVLPEPQ